MSGSHPGAGSLSEFDAPAGRMLVHDPTTTKAFQLLAQVPTEELEERYLFRCIPDHDAFALAHAALVSRLARAGIEPVFLGQVVDTHARVHLDGNPNHVYTRDSAITLPWLPGWFIRGSMRKTVRRREPDVMASALVALGLQELFAMPPGLVLEGGDVIPLARDGRRTLLVGFGPRTTRPSLTELRDRLLPWALDELVGIELVPERMNLDGVLVPVASDTILVEPTSIVRSSLLDATGERPVDIVDLLGDSGMQPVHVTRIEATTMQACNCVGLGGRRLIAYDLCDRVTQALRARDLDVQTIPGAELIKGTGGPRCMTRPLYV